MIKDILCGLSFFGTLIGFTFGFFIHGWLWVALVSAIVGLVTSKADEKKF